MVENAERRALISDGLRRTWDAAGRMLREKPSRFVRIFARLARKRARLGMEAFERGDVVAAASLLAWAKDAIGVAAQQREFDRYYPAAVKGRKFNRGGCKPKLDALGKLILRALGELPPRASAQEVLAKVEEIDGGRVIQDIDRDDPDGPVIYWQHRRRDRPPTSFKSFQNRIANIRKKNREAKIPSFA